MAKNRNRLIPVFLILIFSIASAQLYHVENYSKKQGLPQLQVFDIEQDSYAFMWFGTGGGIARYDGQSFLHLSLEDGLLDNEILSISEDDKKRLWVGTALGVNCIDISDYVHPLVDTTNVLLKNIRTPLLHFDDLTGSLWIATKDSGIYQYKNDSIIHRYEADYKTYLLDNDVLGNIWCNDGTLLLKFDARGKLMGSLDMKDFGTPVALLSSTDSIAVVMTDRGMYSVKQSNLDLTDLEYAININERDFTDALRDYDGTLWISSTNGLFRSEGNSLHILSEKNGLINNNIRCLKEDREGNIWLGTYSAGVSKILSTHVISFNEGAGQRFTVVNSIAKSDALGMTIGTDAGIFAYLNQNLVRIPGTEVLNTRDVWTTLIDERGRLFVGTDEGLFIFARKNTGFQLQHRFIRDKSIFNIYEDRQGRIWIAAEGSLYMMIQDHPAEFIIMPQVQLDNIWTVYQRQDSSMLFGSTVGLIEFKNSTFRLYGQEDGYRGGSVYVIHEDDQNNLWLGCDRGVYTFKNDEFRLLNQNIGLQGSVVTDIIDPGDGTMWFCSDKGANLFDGQKIVRTLSMANGLIGEEFSTDNASYLDDQGRLWFGLFGGLTIFGPEATNNPEIAPNLFVTEVQVSTNKTLNHPTIIADSTILNYDENILNFRYSALSFKYEKQIRYRTFLEGYDQQWSDWRYESVSRYTNLDPGKYIFHVRAQNGLGVQTNRDALFHFVIKTPFWQQFWFLFVLLLGFLASGYAILSYKTKSIERRNKLLEDHVVQRTRALSQAKKYVESIIENVGDIIITTDNEGIVLTWNKEAAQVFGYDKEEMLAQNIDKLDHKEDTVQLRHFFSLVKETGAIRQQELRKKDKNGQPVELLMSMNRLRNPFGGPEGFSIVLSDISERNRLHEALLNREKLLGGIDAMQKLLGTLSHHINNSITAIYGMAQLSEMKNEFDEKFLSSTKYHTHKIQAVLKSLSVLVDEVNLKSADYAGDKEKIFDIENEIRKFIDDLNKETE